MADFDEVAQLFHVFKASHEHGDQFKHIRDAAMARLRAINEEHAPKKDASDASTDQAQQKNENAPADGLLGEAHDSPAEPQPQRRA